MRIAALVNVGAQEWVTLSAIIRDDAGVPIALGPIERVSLLPGDGRGLAWLGDDVLGVLTMDGEVQQLIELQVGGPGVPSIVPPTRWRSLASTTSPVRGCSAARVSCRPSAARAGRRRSRGSSSWRRSRAGRRPLLHRRRMPASCSGSSGRAVAASASVPGSGA
ncbi:hypothetical protein KAE78_10795 [Microbacterium sp. NIBRBAC000506063]|nr:hypothetical protein KAE78_10795 [Microbacterium sp. NIBRBAC000506063]